MKRLVVFMAVCVISATAFGFDFRCNFGAQCVATQGTKIPTEKAIELSDRCDEFIKDDIGRRVLKMSLKEIMDASKGSPMHPLFGAQYAFDVLRNSPLKFERKSNTEDTNYFEVKRSCLQLNLDFNDKSKWKN